jgi:hypothetical protein
MKDFHQIINTNSLEMVFSNSKLLIYPEIVFRSSSAGSTSSALQILKKVEMDGLFVPASIKAMACTLMPAFRARALLDPSMLE